MHLGRSNAKATYSLGGSILKSSHTEKDLGIRVDSDMKFTEQCNAAIRSANSVLGLIKRTIKNKTKNIIVRLYKGLVRPKLEYCVQAWNPYLQGNIRNLERIQRPATKMIEEFNGMSYMDRLHAIGLTSLKDRLDRGDMIEVFKIIKQFDRVDQGTFFKLEESRKTRGHMYKLEKNRSRLDIRKHFFSQRVVNG